MKNMDFISNKKFKVEITQECEKELEELYTYISKNLFLFIYYNNIYSFK